ncbi:hypothetical protein F4821DRAFT_97206 [Hypoxylon rubiginosum]|uniref:Uncharacterized protein n=1 Tax=Hypoxylon rubiginosum TaxID=110542 RepID=A0ACC0D5G5_9PEZI|nr:hypothetical protein F4821DRAFT_97206 [Hypoxylon rubiginosum]
MLLGLFFSLLILLGTLLAEVTTLRILTVALAAWQDGPYHIQIEIRSRGRSSCVRAMINLLTYWRDVVLLESVIQVHGDLPIHRWNPAHLVRLVCPILPLPPFGTRPIELCR